MLRSFKDFSSTDSTQTENRCIECPTDDGCQDCSDNICKTCKPGYFMIDNQCYSCGVYQQGCNECNNLQTCQKCNPNGYVLSKASETCACDEQNGFQRTTDRDQCLCRNGEYNIRVIDGDKQFPKSCAKCREIYDRCN